MQVSFILNGKDIHLDVPAERRLVDILRYDLQLTGTKEGCAEGECGACTVIMDKKAVHSCLVLACQLEGHNVLTIEGLEKNGDLDPLQEAFINEMAIQCGYCTPGMIMSAKALLMNHPNASKEEIREAIAGNICRCSAYEQIINAIQKAQKHSLHEDVLNE